MCLLTCFLSKDVMHNSATSEQRKFEPENLKVWCRAVCKHWGAFMRISPLGFCLLQQISKTDVLYVSFPSFFFFFKAIAACCGHLQSSVLNKVYVLPPIDWGNHFHISRWWEHFQAMSPLPGKMFLTFILFLFIADWNCVNFNERGTNNTWWFIHRTQKSTRSIICSILYPFLDLTHGSSWIE